MEGEAGCWSGDETRAGEGRTECWSLTRRLLQKLAPVPTPHASLAAGPTAPLSSLRTCHPPGTRPLKAHPFRTVPLQHLPPPPSPPAPSGTFPLGTVTFPPSGPARYSGSAPSGPRPVLWLRPIVAPPGTLAPPHQGPPGTLAPPQCFSLRPVLGPAGTPT